MKSAIVFVVLVCLVGCVTPNTFSHAKKSPQEQAKDKANCQVKAGQACSHFNAGLRGQECRKEVETNCMVGEGYSVK